MRPIKVIERVSSAIGELVLSQRDDEFSLRLGGDELMNSRNHQSESELGKRACARIAAPDPRVMIGGLGLGYTLRAALATLPATARVDVVEIVPELVRWNRGVLGHLANHPLEDPRTTVIEDDVAHVIARSVDRYDAIVLDVDNGPDPMHPRNAGLYRRRGLIAARRALRTGGILSVWSTFQSPTFTSWLRGEGFAVSQEAIKTKGGPTHYLWFATR